MSVCSVCVCVMCTCTCMCVYVYMLSTVRVNQLTFGLSVVSAVAQFLPEIQYTDSGWAPNRIVVTQSNS